jgi:hypothetical protein
MSWSSRRQFSIIAALAFAVFVPIVGVAVYFLWERPSCEDGIQNGGERDVDCGGPCRLVCTREANPPTVLWVRPFEVAPGWYNVVALIENSNAAARADGLAYRVRVYDEDEVAVAEREGILGLDPQSVLPVVELGLETGARRGVRASFEWLGAEPRWVTAAPEARLIVVADERIEEQGIEPRVRASVQNIGVLPVEGIAVVAVAYGPDGNAIAASRTLVNRLEGGESRPVVFTWPAPWPAEATGLEVIPVYNAPAPR